MNQQDFNQQLCEFLTHATTPFHAVSLIEASLLEAGFTALEDSPSWQLQPGGRYYTVRNGSSIVAFILGRDITAGDGLRMVGAHTDSPCLMVKPNPEKITQGYFQLGVEVYGGALLNPWFDRDLSLAGKVSFVNHDGQLMSRLIDFRNAIASIPSLAIHLDREANKNRSINPQKHILPILMRTSRSARGRRM